MNNLLPCALAALALSFAGPVAHAGGYAPDTSVRQTVIVPDGVLPMDHFVKQPAVALRLRALIGQAGYEQMLRNLEVQSQLQNDARTVVVTGCRQHECAANGFVLAYDRVHDALRVWRVSDGHVSAANEASWRGAPLHGNTLQYIHALGK